MPLLTPPIKNIKEVTEPLKEQILKGDVYTIDGMRAWLKPLGYSDTINEAAINFILREFVMNKVSSDSIMNMDMVVNILRPQLEHQTCSLVKKTSAISHLYDCTIIVTLLVHQDIYKKDRITIYVWNSWIYRS